ncbi:hypothetical protein [Hymenobacter koreensis]|uniref:Adhesin domain-containing protein n=1 Tax=Hymenobacter koreensis TaxID=1084523 RepID=A0ABP8IWP5_9BACT
MKTAAIFSLVLTLLWLPSRLPAQDRKDHTASDKFNKEFALTGNVSRATLALYNIMGSVTVQGYSGKNVVVEVTRTLKAATPELLERGKKEAQPGFDQHGDSVLVYVAGPQDSRPQRRNNNGNSYQGRFSDNWTHNNSDRPGYTYSFDFVVKVPAAMEVRASTVNGGKMLVEDVTGPLQARNVNGSVTIRNAKSATVAHTVNGNVDVSYTDAPTSPATYHTVNGSITVTYPPNVSGDLHFKSLNGHLYTDFPQAEILPARVTANQQQDGQGTKYKLKKDTAVRLGKGGVDFRFETVNGNVTVKKQTR